MFAFAFAFAFALALAGAGACVVEVPATLDAGDDVDADTDSTDLSETTDSTGDTTDTATAESSTTGDGLTCTERLDVMVVLDNSGSMGSAQRQLTDAFPALVAGLDQAGVDWRVAVTTTDNGNPWCPAGTTTPEGGAFVYSSCRDRLGDFLFAGDVDQQDYACNDICDLSSAQLQPLPTTTAIDPTPKPRPWIQREDGLLNLPAGVDLDDALRCVLPQGINGCGFESQLESMRLAIQRAASPEQAQAGFLRDDASLLILIVTDEADCSYDKDWSAIFDANGNRVFWSDPNASFPTSAVCWNAGVDCIGDPQGFDDCVAANKNIDGQPSGPADAVLLPVTDYTELLLSLQDDKRSSSGDPSLQVAMLAITGVGANGQPSYAESTLNDPAFQDSFGIGPGCKFVDPLQGFDAAVPPVRIRELGAALGSVGGLASICAEDYQPYMTSVVDQLVGDCP